MKRFSKAAWIFLAYNLLVIVWGGLVRATGSGAGCGDHWPLCNGEWIPQHPQLRTLIELTHRGMSGFALIGVIGLWIGSRKIFPKGSLVRVGAIASVLFMLSEAAIGAGLVLLKLVAQDTSLLRAGYLSVHLLNTFLLLAALTLTAWASRHPQVSWQNLRRGKDVFLYIVGLIGTLLLGVTGGIAALGDTLFPSHSLQEGFAHDFMPGIHFLLRLRILHPVLAILVALYLVFLALRSSENKGSVVLGVVLAQIFIGGWNLLWLAPIFLQLLHLVMADTLWIALLLFTFNSLTENPS
jgi:cytochrome c oxidase assembly protein subunit 15